MTYSRMVEILSSRTGYDERVVRHVLDEQGELIKRCMTAQEEVHLKNVLKLTSSQRMFRWKDRLEKRIVVKIRLMRPFRKELNKWTSSE